MIRQPIMGVSAFSASQDEQFIRSLAAELGEIRSMLEAVFDEPEASSPRERLAETLRSFSAEAATIGFDGVVEDLSACDGILQSAAVLGQLDFNDGDLLSEALDRIADTVRTRLACEITPSSGSIKTLIPATGVPHDGELRDVEPGHVLIVAAATVVDGLVLSGGDVAESGPPLAIEQVSDVVAAREVVRALGPDVIVLDTGLEGARSFVEALVNDELTDAIPIVAIGDWASPEDAAPYIALGVAKHLTKPVSPRGLRRALAELSPTDVAGFEPIGDGTLDAISARLADELHRGLCDAATESSRDQSIAVGDGSDVLATLWSAVGRIRELLTVKAGGQLQFVSGGPADAVVNGPWMGGSLSSRLAQPSARRAAEDESLEGLTVLVAEGDLSMNWFLCGVLRDAGAEVIDSFDGQLALSTAYQSVPDLVLCDVLLPKIDGATLCRAFRKDVVLRSIPFVLMSSKDDLLQRAHELGVGADAYLRKESSGERIVKRLLDLSVPSRRIASRLALGGRVRGRLSGLSVYSILQLACKHRPSCRFSLSDATRKFEIEIREGRPISATVTDVAGQTVSGSEVLNLLVAVGMGRFDVQDIADDEHVAVELEGSLQDLVATPLANVRGAQSLFTGSGIVGVQRVQFGDLHGRVCFESMPKFDRDLLLAIQGGASPRELIVTGQASAHHIETVLCDVATRSGIVGVILCNGTDALPRAIEQQRALLCGSADYTAVMAAHSGTLVSMSSKVPMVGLAELSSRAEETQIGPVVTRLGSPCSVQPSRSNTAVPPGVAVQAAPVVDVGISLEVSPHHLEDSPGGGGVIMRTTTPTGEEVQYSGPLGRQREPVFIDKRHCTPLLASASVALSSPSHNETPILATVAADELDSRGARLAGASANGDVDRQRNSEAGFTKARDSIPEGEDFPKLPRLPRPSAYAKRAVASPESKPSRASRFLWPLLFGLVGVCMAIGARWMRDSAPAPAPTLPAPDKAAPASGQPIKKAPAADSSPVDTSPAARPEIFELTPKERASLRTGQGLVEVVAGRGHKIAVDGKELGAGPVRKVALEAREKTYEIRVTMLGEQRVRYVMVTADKRTRIRVAPPWSR
jgi:CheY-like chemotaxis protein